MIPAGAWILSLAALPSAAEEAHYVDASLDLGGSLLSWRFLDLEPDGSPELFLAVRTASGERELRVHRLRGDRLEPVPETTIAILDDVIAWGLADVREESGRELVFLTRAGAWSYSTTLPGYADNVRRLVHAPLVYDMPDPRALPHWAYVLPSPEGDSILLPGRDGYSIWGPGPGEREGDGEALYEPRAHFAAAVFEPQSDSQRRRAPAFIRLESSPFLRSDRRGSRILLESDFRYRAPALVDLDADDFLDLVTFDGVRLTIHRGGPDGPPALPTRVEQLPEELTGDDELDLTLLDWDGDGVLDLLAQVTEDVDGLENALQRLIFYRGTPERLLADEPTQVLRFEAAVLIADFADVDGDGRIDLGLRKLELPSIVGTVAGLEFTFSYLVFPGERRGFARRPMMRQDETYDEDTVVELAANRELVLDCNGDGFADLVEIDLNGDIAIRRLQKESSLLRGTRWEVEAAPWKRFPLDGSIESLHVEDLNGDGLGDIVSAGGTRLNVLLSVRGGGR